jgi:hypothetical protein
VLAHAGGNSTQVMELPPYLASGIYQLEITGPDKARTVQAVVVK